jgi:hypothetical protein
VPSDWRVDKGEHQIVRSNQILGKQNIEADSRSCKYKSLDSFKNNWFLANERVN